MEHTQVFLTSIVEDLRGLQRQHIERMRQIDIALDALRKDEEKRGGWEHKKGSLLFRKF